MVPTDTHSLLCHRHHPGLFDDLRFYWESQWTRSMDGDPSYSDLVGPLPGHSVCTGSCFDGGTITVPPTSHLFCDVGRSPLEYQSSTEVVVKSLH